MIRTARTWLSLALLALLVSQGAARAQSKPPGPGPSPMPPGQPKVLKIASLAPEGSSWMKLFHVWAGAIEKRAPGIKIKFFPGGVAGDERDAVRKMRLGQLNGAAVTAIGLGLIQPQVRVLEIPFLIKSYNELDFVREKLDGEFRKLFQEKGFELLFWGDVGQVQLFSNIPVDSVDSLSKMKIWAWTDDPMVRKLFEKVKLNAVPLGVPDVLPALQTGTIDACYGSTLSTLALQWNTKVKHMTSMVISQSVGATVLTKAGWDSLSPDEQKIVREESARLAPVLLKTIREDNKRAYDKMLKLGMTVVPTPQAVMDRFTGETAAVATSLDGQLFTKEFRLRVTELLKTCPPDRCPR